MGTRPVKSSGPLRPVGLGTERPTSEKPNRPANSDGPGTNHRSGPIDHESSIETYASIDERGGFWAKRKLRESAHPAREGADRRILVHRKEAERFPHLAGEHAFYRQPHHTSDHTACASKYQKRKRRQKPKSTPPPGSYLLAVPTKSGCLFQVRSSSTVRSSKLRIACSAEACRASHVPASSLSYMASVR